VLESQLFRIRVEVFDATARPVYRQTSRYWWPDGREFELVYDADFDGAGDRIVIDTDRMTGSCRAIDDDVLYIEFGFRATPRQRVGEMIQLSRDGRHRARTWHWYEDERLARLTLVRERRTSLDPADWPATHARPTGFAFDSSAMA
jgi:hypothetical protein